MQGNLAFGPQGTNLQLGFASIEEVKQFIEQAIKEPARQFGYEIKLEKVAEEEKKGNVGVL